MLSDARRTKAAGVLLASLLKQRCADSSQLFDVRPCVLEYRLIIDTGIVVRQHVAEADDASRFRNRSKELGSDSVDDVG